MIRRQAVLIQLVVAILFVGSVAQAQEEGPRADFARLGQSSALNWSASAIERFARLPDADVLPALLETYLSPPPVHSLQVQRFLVSAISSRGLRGPEDLRLVQAFITRLEGRFEHSWAVRAVCEALARAGHEAPVEDLTESAREPLHRAEALAALALSPEKKWLSRAPVILARIKAHKSTLERALMIEALAGSIAVAVEPWFAREAAKMEDLDLNILKQREAARLALSALIDLLAERSVLPRSSREIHLALQKALGTPGVYSDPEAWRARLSNRAMGTKETESTTRERASVRFMSLEGHGRSFVFLLDASDSMLNPLTEAEQEAFIALLPKPEPKEAEKTGSSQERGGKSQRSIVPPKNRFDAARMHIFASLDGIDPEHSFAIVIFGTRASAFAATPGFVRATANNIKTVKVALAGVNPGAVTGTRPYGTLQGNTNIYLGLQTAYRMSPWGVLETEHSDSERKLLAEGADTVFVLTDGSPTEDGFSGMTPPVKRSYQPVSGGGGGQRIDPETGLPVGKPMPAGGPARPVGEPVTVTQSLPEETGPYIQGYWLGREVERLSHLRRTIVHVISIGEAGTDVPAEIARAGRGRFLRVGG